MERGDSSVLLQAIVLIAIYDSKMASDLSLPVLSAIKVGGGGLHRGSRVPYNTEYIPGHRF